MADDGIPDWTSALLNRYTGGTGGQPPVPVGGSGLDVLAQGAGALLQNRQRAGRALQAIPQPTSLTEPQWPRVANWAGGLLNTPGIVEQLHQHEEMMQQLYARNGLTTPEQQRAYRLTHVETMDPLGRQLLAFAGNTESAGGSLASAIQATRGPAAAAAVPSAVTALAERAGLSPSVPRQDATPVAEGGERVAALGEAASRVNDIREAANRAREVQEIVERAHGGEARGVPGQEAAVQDLHLNSSIHGTPVPATVENALPVARQAGMEMPDLIHALRDPQIYGAAASRNPRLLDMLRTRNDVSQMLM